MAEADKAPKTFLQMRERIVERYPALSPQLKSIAQFALANPDMMAVETAAQLSERLRTPASSLVRFAQALGYSGFLEMRRAFNLHLMYRAQVLEAPVPVVHGAAALVGEALSAARRSLSVFEHDFDADAFNRAAEALHGARQIFVAAQHRSYPLASLFAWTMLEEGRSCILLDNVGGYALRQSNLAEPEDATLTISFNPYQPSVVEAAKAHAERGGTVVAVTDTELSPLAPHATEMLTLPGTHRSALLSDAVVLVGALAKACTNPSISKANRAGSTRTEPV